MTEVYICKISREALDGLRKWNLERAFHIKWKTVIPGFTHASPVIWSEHVFISTAIRSDTSAKLRAGLYDDVAQDKDISKHSWRFACLDSNKIASGIKNYQLDR